MNGEVDSTYVSWKTIQMKWKSCRAIFGMAEFSRLLFVPRYFPENGRAAGCSGLMLTVRHTHIHTTGNQLKFLTPSNFRLQRLQHSLRPTICLINQTVSTTKDKGQKNNYEALQSPTVIAMQFYWPPSAIFWANRNSDHSFLLMVGQFIRETRLSRPEFCLHIDQF